MSEIALRVEPLGPTFQHERNARTFELGRILLIDIDNRYTIKDFQPSTLFKYVFKALLPYSNAASTYFAHRDPSGLPSNSFFIQSFIFTGAPLQIMKINRNLYFILS
jgi:hypothetical protein